MSDGTTTITVGRDIADQLKRIKLDLERDQRRPVSLSEAVGWVLGQLRGRDG
jgi:hypothetical protein